jgi:large subunit ribosomal protein L30
MALEVTQVKSSNGAKHNQLATLESLGLRRMRHTVVVADRPEIRGMVATVNHLVAVREVEDGALPPKKTRRLTASDAGESGVVGDATGASQEMAELLDEQGLTGQGIDNPSDVVQHPRQAVPDDVTVKVSGGNVDDADDAPTDDAPVDDGPVADDEE